MSDIAIKVENLGKLYRLGEVGTGTLSHDLNRWWAQLRGKEDPFAKIGETNDRTAKGSSDYVWSLKDVNFEVKQGEVLGIIGRNGAGKSTLLKLLSKVTSPTTGRIKVNGRIASLLEVGTGFHPELTGRENIFLNGAILGMTKAEIRSKFDEIVDFAGVERYIDTPVKRYSSGMYVRLAFAVSAFLEPDILIVDEVLAVGDAEFQRKCMGKMSDVNKDEGRTILFVSHNMAAMQKLCKTGMLMQNGKLISTGEMRDVIDQYLTMGISNDSQSTFNIDENRIAGVLKVLLANENGEPIYEVPIGKKWIIKVYYQINSPVKNFICAAGLLNPLDLPLNTSWQKPLSLEPGVYCAEFKETEIIYATGRYKVSIGLSIGIRNIQHIEDAISLNIIPLIDTVDETVMKHDANTCAILNQFEMKTYKL
jgi:lipopolysaccharide transport system ATP-binding protein